MKLTKILAFGLAFALAGVGIATAQSVTKQPSAATAHLGGPSITTDSQSGDNELERNKAESSDPESTGGSDPAAIGTSTIGYDQVVKVDGNDNVGNDGENQDWVIESARGNSLRSCDLRVLESIL